MITKQQILDEFCEQFADEDCNLIEGLRPCGINEWLEEKLDEVVYDIPPMAWADDAKTLTNWKQTFLNKE